MIISNANKIYIGSQEASKIYIGSNLVFSSLWSPDQLGSSLVLWLDANDSNTIILNGSSVSQWSDKSGNNRNATQAVATNQPIYNINSLNNKAGIQFDGINDIMFNTMAGAAIGSQPFTLFCVVKYPTKNSRFLSLREPPYGTGTARLYFIKGGTNIFQITAGDPAITTANMSVTQDVGQLLAVAKESNSIIRPYINSVGQTTISPLFPSPYGELRIGALTTTDCSNVTFNEICIHIGVMSTSDMQKMEGYLAWKWGLVDKLPSNHLYKNGPP